MDTSRKHSFSTGESRSPIPSSFTRIDHQPIQSHVRFNTSRFFVDRYNSSALNVQFNKDDESLITHREEKHNKRTYSLSWIISWEDLGPFTEGNNWPLFTYLMGILIALLFLGELLLSIQNSGEAFELDPFNYMIGPSQEILIQSGARFSPCMKHVDSMPSNGHYVCLKTITANRTPQAIKSAETASSVPMNGIDTPTLILLDQLVNLNNPKVSNSTCSLSTICGMTPFYLSQKPDQLFRFVTPLFAHTGIFHVIINLCILIPIGRRLERSLNSLRYSVIIIGSGIFGHVVGANYSSATMRK
ncbi:hypothetical protein BDB01DRAFT_847257 [Pilobolus umbonatus]|nr:hypothetical protein BDB01DRAFT_847257 [Pilobolus umbonatus]